MKNIKNILLGVTGSIAAYKTPELCRLLMKNGYAVKVIVTHSAAQFVSVLTLKTLTEDQVFTVDSLSDLNQQALEHIYLARWADLILIAPASANIMAKLAAGITDDLLTSTCLANPKAPIFLAPSMNVYMWGNKATVFNKETLIQRGFTFLGPESGDQACGDNGEGRLIDLEKIILAINHLNTPPLFKGKHILITAGPTQEPIDPVRYISNRSSGKMGYALAKVALQMGAKVTLVSGMVNLKAPEGALTHLVNTADEMLHTVLEQISTVDIFIGTAAVADWKIKTLETNKIKQKESSIKLEFIPNPDIVSKVALLPLPPFVVGFCAETQDLIKYAKEKLVRKKLNMVVANDISKPDIGFHSDYNEVCIITKKETLCLDKNIKTQIAYDILQQIAREYHP